MDISWNYKDKTCVVTGAANGIGAELCKLLATSGAEVVLVDNDKDNLARATKACADIARTPPLSILADISQKEGVERMISLTIERFKKIDFLVAGAGILYRTPLMDIELDEWDEIFDTNVRGLFMCNQLVIKEMLKRDGGRIVNIASVAGRRAIAFKSH